MPLLKDILIEQLVRHEGYSSKPYKDTVGKTTIGYGRNIQDVGISNDEARFLLMTDINKAIVAAKTFFPTFDFLTANRQAVLANMAFNMGLNRLSTFARFRNCIAVEDYRGAAKEMLDSKWATQVGGRAKELAALMELG